MIDGQTQSEIIETARVAASKMHRLDQRGLVPSQVVDEDEIAALAIAVVILLERNDPSLFPTPVFRKALS
jgi:aspartate 1-decarboxylase